MTNSVTTPVFWLASSSPRRKELLAAHGFEAECVPPDLDDAALRPASAKPSHWAVAMAMFKGARVREMLRARSPQPGGLIIAADTICDLDDRIVGKPRSAAHARAILHAFRGRMHWTRTGVCLLDIKSGESTLLLDSARVSLGDVDDAEIDAYVASGAWQGKAGGYNYAERLAAGWPLTCDGDPTSVMGLPMKRLVPFLRRASRQGTTIGAPA